MKKTITLFLLCITQIVTFSCSSDEGSDSNIIASSEDDNSDVSINVCEDTNCANYSSREEAQRAFDLDPECRKSLDHDGDGFACEEPDNEVTPKTCASTSSCGCSNKNKSPCEADPCCKWTTGEGCGCN